MSESSIFPKRQRLGEILVARDLVTLEQLEAALDYQRDNGVFLGQALVSLGMLTPRALGPYMRDLTTFPFVELSSYSINLEVARALPEEFVREKMALPFDQNDVEVYVAMVKPLDLALVDNIRTRLKRRVRPHLVFQSDLEDAIGKVFSGREKVQLVLSEMSNLDEIDVSVDELMAQAEEAPIVRLVNGITQAAILGGASDIHIEPQERNVRVRFRQDGLLYEQTQFSRQHLAAVISRIKIMAGMNIAERRKPQDGQISYRNGPACDVDLRVSILPQVYGESVVMRVLDKMAVRKSMVDLGMEDTLAGQAETLLKQPHGLILVTGPTGSGKTTTLYAMLNAINAEERKIITVEDPVEYHLPGVNQVQVNHGVGLTFAAGLRSIVRQDPDVVLVGEIRDRETAEVAIQAAMTGHLVLSTLHTNDAPGALVRLQNMGVEPFLISSAVIGVIAQRLVRTVCPACREQYHPSRAIRQLLGIAATDDDGATLSRGAGCSRCGQRGMKGRLAVFELMRLSSAISELALRGASGRELREQALADGMVSMRDYAIQQVLRGVTTPEEVTRVLFSPEEITEPQMQSRAA